MTMTLASLGMSRRRPDPSLALAVVSVDEPGCDITPSGSYPWSPRHCLKATLNVLELLEVAPSLESNTHPLFTSPRLQGYALTRTA